MLTYNWFMSRTSEGGGDVFRAVADPTRRRILDLLSEGERPVNSLAQPFGMTRPAISQHLRVLREAGLVSERRMGRKRCYRLRAERLREIDQWVQNHPRGAARPRRGVQRGTSRRPWGMWAQFKDVDGNEFGLIQWEG